MRKSTLIERIGALLDQGLTDDEAEAIILRQLRDGSLQLTGSFAGLEHTFTDTQKECK